MDEAMLLENIFRIVEGKPITRPQTPLPASAFQVQTQEQQGQRQFHRHRAGCKGRRGSGDPYG